MKFAVDRPYSDPEKAARKLIEIANAVGPVQDGRIFIELINKAARPNTRLALMWRLLAVGYGCTNPAHM
jgi:hypothetical protein